MTEALPVPLVVLGGSDRRPTELPEPGRDKHPLAGYKGVTIGIRGRPLIAELFERLGRIGAFAPLFVAGPARVYGDTVAAESILDTDSTFGENVRVSIESVARRCPGRAIAFLTCDILPDVDGLRRLLAEYERAAPCDLWFPLVRVPVRPEALGASAWKPAYRMRPERDRPAVGVLPGHLLIVDPAALRTHLVYRLLDVGYRTRNRSIDRRRSVMIRGVLADMLLGDLRRVVRLRAPTMTWSILRAALPAARLLREGTICRGDLEDALRKIFVRQPHRRRFPARRVVLPIVDELFLARDIDTVEEARELGATLEG